MSILRQLGMTSMQLARKVRASSGRATTIATGLPDAHPVSQPDMCDAMDAQVVEVHNKMDLVESTSAGDEVERTGTDDAAAAAAPGVPGQGTADDSLDTPTGSWAVRQLQQDRCASGLLHQPQQLAAAADRQQLVAQPPRVHVSAVTGAGLGTLLQEIDRKVCLPSCHSHTPSLASHSR